MLHNTPSDNKLIQQKSVESHLDSDQALIKACQQGEGRAWEQLLDKYERLVYSIALRYGLEMEDAADVTQITFTILMQSLDGLREDTRLAPWLTTVARRHTWRCLDRRRRERVNSGQDLAENALLDTSDHIEQWERIEWLYQGISRLKKRCRELLLALYFEVDQPSYEETAARFGMAVGSVGPTRARCLEKLKHVLTQAGGQ
jgi:RNA polymerase sigma factor (sigma-70 family)